MPNDTPNNPPNTLISGDLKKLLIVPAMTMIIAVVVAWYAAQQSQSELRYRVETMEKNEAATQASIKVIGDAQNQIVITMARNADALARIAEDLKSVQVEQRSGTTKR